MDAAWDSAPALDYAKVKWDSGDTDTRGHQHFPESSPLVRWSTLAGDQHHE